MSNEPQRRPPDDRLGENGLRVLAPQPGRGGDDLRSKPAGRLQGGRQQVRRPLAADLGQDVGDGLPHLEVFPGVAEIVAERAYDPVPVGG